MNMNMHHNHRRIRCRIRPLPVLILVLLAFAAMPSRAQQAASVRLPLGEAIEQATQRGTRVRQAGASLAAAGAAAGPLASAYLPSVSATAYDLYSQYPVTVTPIREQGVFPPLDDNTYELSVSAFWTIFDFGRGSAARQAVQAVAEAAGVRYDLTRMETIEAVTAHYVRLAQLRDVQRAERQRLEALRRQQEQLEALYEEGRVSHVDRLRIAEVILEAETDLRGTRSDIEGTLLALSAELDAPRPLWLDDLMLFELSSAGSAVALPEGTGRIPPRIAAAQAQLEAARLESRAAGRALLPSFELFATERLRSGSDFAFDDELLGGLRLRVPLFQPGARAQRQVQQARVVEQQAALEAARNEFEVALGDLLNREVEARARVTATEARVRHLEETYRIERAAYDEGRLTLTDLLATEARLSGGRSALAAAKATTLLLGLQRSVLTGTLTPALALHLTGAQP